MKISIADGWLRRKRKIYLLLDLNSGCNIHCIHCYRNAYSPHNGSIDRDQLAILERDVFPYVDKLSLAQSAETLILPILPEVLRAARRTRIHFSCIQTNGTFLTQEKSRMLLDLGLNQMGISLDGATKETFETIRAGAEWESVLENIRTFIRLRDAHPINKIYVSFNFALMRQNAHEAVRFIRFAKQEGANSVTFAHLVVETGEMREWSLIDDPRESNRLSAALREEAKRLGIDARVPRDLPEDIQPFEGGLLESPSYRGHCNAAHQDWLFIMSNGNCYPCLNLQDCGYMGNIFETPFREIWYGEVNQRFRNRALLHDIAEGCDHCKDCTLTDDLGSEMAFLAKRMTTRSAAELDLGASPPPAVEASLVPA